jgi:hypothetical protein
MASQNLSRTAGGEASPLIIWNYSICDNLICAQKISHEHILYTAHLWDVTGTRKRHLSTRWPEPQNCPAANCLVNRR